jgi:hypothetical protein
MNNLEAMEIPLSLDAGDSATTHGGETAGL